MAVKTMRFGRVYILSKIPKGGDYLLTTTH